jgi:hypothetical protein
MKKRHHHVLRGYLKSWTVDGRIYCLRKGQIFPCDLMGVAVERYFYEPQILEPSDIFLIEKAIIELSAEGIKPALRNLLNSFIAVSEMKKRLNALDPESPHYSELEEAIINFEEDYQTTIEERMLPALRSMLAGTTAFYDDREQCADFSNALCVQYTRTKKVRQALTKISSPISNASVRRIANVLSHLAAINVARTLFVERDRFSLVLLDNRTSTPFITGDHPVINLHGDARQPLAPDQFELYYPLSPSKAMLLVFNAGRRAEERSITAEDVHAYNIQIARESHSQIFANCRESLERIRDPV